MDWTYDINGNLSHCSRNKKVVICFLLILVYINLYEQINGECSQKSSATILLYAAEFSRIETPFLFNYDIYNSALNKANHGSG